VQITPKSSHVDDWGPLELEAKHGIIMDDIMTAAVSIWFEIWRVVDPGKKKLIFPGKLKKN